MCVCTDTKEGSSLVQFKPVALKSSLMNLFANLIYILLCIFYCVNICLYWVLGILLNVRVERFLCSRR